MNEVVAHLQHIQALHEAGGGKNIDKVEKRMRRRSDSVVLLSQKPNEGFARQTAVGGIAAAYPRPSASLLFA